MALRTPTSSRRRASSKSSATVPQKKNPGVKVVERKPSSLPVRSKTAGFSKAKSVAPKITHMKKLTSLAKKSSLSQKKENTKLLPLDRSKAVLTRQVHFKKTSSKAVSTSSASVYSKKEMISRAVMHSRQPIGECSRYLLNLNGVLDNYEALVGSLPLSAKIPQEPAWFLENTELEKLQPVLDSLEEVIRAPVLNRRSTHSFESILKPLGRLVGAPVQVIPHVSQIQALHILLHLGDHPDLPTELLFPLTEALYHVAHDEVSSRLGPKAHARTHRLLAQFGKGKKEKGLKALAHKQASN
jgi:hypothetical protein